MAISDKLTRLSTAHDNIAAAIATKGGTVNTGDGFEDFAADIATIPQSSGEDITTEETMRLCDLTCPMHRHYSEKDYAAKYIVELEAILENY